jgi:hypothetical protein
MRRLLAAATFVLLAACGGKSPEPTNPAPDPDPIEEKACVPGGCSSQLCVEEGDAGMSTCEWQESYACYKSATCERQADGACGWTETEELTSCLATATGDDAIM